MLGGLDAIHRQISNHCTLGLEKDQSAYRRSFGNLRARAAASNTLVPSADTRPQSCRRPFDALWNFDGFLRDCLLALDSCVHWAFAATTLTTDTDTGLVKPTRQLATVWKRLVAAIPKDDRVRSERLIICSRAQRGSFTSVRVFLEYDCLRSSELHGEPAAVLPARNRPRDCKATVTRATYRTVARGPQGCAHTHGLLLDRALILGEPDPRPNLG